MGVTADEYQDAIPLEDYVCAVDEHHTEFSPGDQAAALVRAVFADRPRPWSLAQRQLLHRGARAMALQQFEQADPQVGPFVCHLAFSALAEAGCENLQSVVPKRSDWPKQLADLIQHGASDTVERMRRTATEAEVLWLGDDFAGRERPED